MRRGLRCGLGCGLGCGLRCGLGCRLYGLRLCLLRKGLRRLFIGLRCLLSIGLPKGLWLHCRLFIGLPNGLCRLRSRLFIGLPNGLCRLLRCIPTRKRILCTVLFHHPVLCK